MAPPFQLRLTTKQSNCFLARYYLGAKQGMLAFIVSRENIDQIQIFKQLLHVAHGIERSILEFRGILQPERRVFVFEPGSNLKEIIPSKLFFKEYQTHKTFWTVEPFIWLEQKNKFIIEEIYLVCTEIGFYFEIFQYPINDSETRMITELIPYNQLELDVRNTSDISSHKSQ